MTIVILKISIPLFKTAVLKNWLIFGEKSSPKGSVCLRGGGGWKAIWQKSIWTALIVPRVFPNLDMSKFEISFLLHGQDFCIPIFRKSHSVKVTLPSKNHWLIYEKGAQLVQIDFMIKKLLPFLHCLFSIGTGLDWNWDLSEGEVGRV